MHGQASSPVGVAEVVVVEVAVQHTSNTQEPKEMREAPAADDGAAMSEGGAEDTVVQSAERASESRGSGSATPVALFRHSTQRTTWRWPQRPGELPVYIQQRFRSKVFFLVGLQLAIVLLVMCLMDFCIHGRLRLLASFPGLPLLSSIWLIVALSAVSQRHPLSYVVLLLLTLSTGFFWGSVRLSIDTWFHYQALGIPCVTMLLSAAIATATPNLKVDPTTLLYVTMLPAWVVGAIVVIMTSVMLPMPEASEASSSLKLAVGYSAILTWVLLRLDVGRLRKPDPDDFMGAIVRMDIALLPIGLGIPIAVGMGLEGLDADYPEPQRDIGAAWDIEAA